jgi:hypothetical protein
METILFWPFYDLFHYNPLHILLSSSAFYFACTLVHIFFPEITAKNLVCDSDMFYLVIFILCGIINSPSSEYLFVLIGVYCFKFC